MILPQTPLGLEAPLHGSAFPMEALPFLGNNVTLQHAHLPLIAIFMEVPPINGSHSHGSAHMSWKCLPYVAITVTEVLMCHGSAFHI